MMRLSVAHFSERGARAENEDCVGFRANDTLGCFVLADGAGGYRGGAIAARSVVSQVIQRFGCAPNADRAVLEWTLAAARQGLSAARSRHPEAPEMNATLATLLVDTQRARALWNHLGDTRIYLFRHGRARALTRDHSVLQSLIDAGMADGGTRGSVERNVLYASVGTEEMPPHTCCPAPLEVHAGDVFLLCSDGFWEMLDEASMEAMLAASRTPEQWLERMSAQIAARRAEGQDNFSAMAVWVGCKEEVTRILPRHRRGADTVTGNS